MGKPVSAAPPTVVRRRGGFQQQFNNPNNRRGNMNNQRPVGFRPKVAPAATSSAYNRKWLEKADQEKTPFSDELMTTTFGKENVEKLVSACKTATESEVSESNRLLNDDYIYSVQITSHRVPHVPVHLSRM